MKEILIEHGNNKIFLKKEGNVKLSIEGPDKKIYEVLFYEVTDSNGQETYKCIYSPPVLSNGWSCVENLNHTSNNYPIEISIHLMGEMGWFSDFLYNNNDKKFYKINNIRNIELLNKVRPPIIILGTPGGGTSYITKILKFCGLYFGTDSGSINLRKNHESISFTTINHSLYFKKGTFLSGGIEDEILRIKEIAQKEKTFYTILFKNQLEYKFNRFWGDMPHDLMWAWKDPGASLTLPIWKNIFPECKILMIYRNKDKLSKNISDAEGNWFRDKATHKSKEAYLNPDLSGIKDENIFHCNFNEVVTDRNSMNKMLQWIGFSEQLLKTDDTFLKLLQATGYEGKNSGGE